MRLFKSDVIIFLCRSFVARRQRAGRPADESCEQHEQLEPGDSGEPAGEPAASLAASPTIGAGVNDDDTSIHPNGHFYRGGKARGRGHPPASGADQPRERGGGRRLCAQEKAASLQNDLYQLPVGGA